MGIIKRAGDLVYTFRFLKLLTTSFKDTEAYKRGIIDDKGKRLKSFDLNIMTNRDIYKNYYTPFHRLVYNIKKLIAKVPGGGSKLGSYAAALYLLKEKYGVKDKDIHKALKLTNIDPLDFMLENTQWFVLEDKQLSPGIYKILNEEKITDSLDEVIHKRDNIKIKEDCYPSGEIFGLSIYKGTHLKTNLPVYVTIGELAR